MSRQREGLKPAGVMRAVVALIAATIVTTSPRPASGYWNDARSVVIASAQTLERGSFSVGVLAPLQYGVLDDLLLTTHPILHLLLTPNLAVRWRLISGQLALSLQVGYQQTFLDRRDGGFPGTVHGELLASVCPLDWLEVTVSGGYGWGFYPSNHHLPIGLTLHFLPSHSDLIVLQATSAYSATDRTWSRVSAQILYAHAWHTLHLGAGVAIGRFAFRPWGDVSFEVHGVPLYPTVDVWWRF